MSWWKEPDMGVPAGEREGCAAARMWRAACGTLRAPDADDAWKQIVDTSPSDALWHSIRNCVAYQAGIWQKLISKGIEDVVQPAAFKLAIVLRHTPSEVTVKLLTELLRSHPQSQDLTSYVLALLTDDEAQWCGSCGEGESGGGSPTAPPGPAPLRDLQLFGDCELAVLAASKEEYDAHAKLVRAEYSKLTQEHYVELRIKVLNQFNQIPKLFHTPEFEDLESAARENIEREISTLREHLSAARKD
ncbi:uncharacterized protein LOC135083348 [Ostrinia nubilalis]|uniref:uncharacterized protein LOC114355305 n=1 Tax=Ostrinia furnacalis TaxID=93504 RepID=UPI00103C794D|nr:uncharacterized protein LOC114355305 [Ostrinia furnacalis]